MFTQQPSLALAFLLEHFRIGAFLFASYSKFRPKAYYAATEEQESQYLLNLKEEDEDKFMEHLFRTYYAPLCKTVYNITHETEAAEDIVQDVFLKVWRRRDQLDLCQSIKSYLFRSSVNTALNYLEKSRRNTAMEESDHDNIRFSSNSTEETLRQQEVSQRISQAVDALPPKCRTVFALSRYEELSYAEISEQLDISIKAVEKHMSKALKLMRNYLQSFINHSA